MQIYSIFKIYLTNILYDLILIATNSCLMNSQHGQSMIRGGHGSNEEDSSSQLSDDLEKKYDSSSSLLS